MTTKKAKIAPGKDAGQKSGIPKKQPAKSKTAKMSIDARVTMIKKALNEEKMGTHITIKQVRSGAGRSVKQNATLVGLGLRKIGRVSTLQDSPETRGMMIKVAHLIEVIDAA